MKSVLVHECFDAESLPCVKFPTFGERYSKEIFVKNPNSFCSCARRIEYRRRDEMLSNDDIRVIIPFGDEFPDWRHVIVLRRKVATRAQTITSGNMISATVYGNRFQQNRIEAYGAMTQMMFAGLGAARG